jgi:hypothetical protein
MQNRAYKNQQRQGKVDKNLAKRWFRQVIASPSTNDILGIVRKNCVLTDFFPFFAENFVFETDL